MRKILLERCYNTEYYDVPDTIEATITEDLEQAIDEWGNAIEQAHESDDPLRRVGLSDAGLDFEWDDKVYGRIGYSSVLVYRGGTWYLEIQNKYDSSLQAEYQERLEESCE